MPWQRTPVGFGLDESPSDEGLVGKATRTWEAAILTAQGSHWHKPEGHGPPAVPLASL